MVFLAGGRRAMASFPLCFLTKIEIERQRERQADQQTRRRHQPPAPDLMPCRIPPRPDPEDDDGKDDIDRKPGRNRIVKY